MALEQRGKKGTWYIVSLTDNAGKPIRKSTHTTDRALAEQIEAKLKLELFNERHFGIKPDRPLKEAVKDFLKEKEIEGLRSLNDYERQLTWWQEQLPGAMLREIDKGTIVQTVRLKRTKDKASNATLNRYCAALRACLHHAVAMDWLDKVPVFPRYDEPRERVRWLTSEQVVSLLDNAPEDWRPMIRMALATGLRQSNVLRMRWEWVDMKDRVLTVPGELFKNGDEFCIPLEGDAWKVIEEQVGKHPVHVFSPHQGKPMESLRHDIWSRICKAAGLPGLRWHDMRHAWATNLARSGVSTQVLQRLGGWKTMAMVNKYAHHDVESLRGAAGVAGQVVADAAQILQTSATKRTKRELKLVVNA